MAQLPAGNDRHIPERGEGKLEPNYYCRGWNAKRGKYCGQRAGAGTDHLGQGRCRWHGGATPISHGRYSTIERDRIRDLIAEFEADPDPLNLLPDLAALRAIFRDFIERYDQNASALLVWYGNIPEELLYDLLTVAGPRPRTVMDIADAAKILKEIGVMVARIEKIRADSAISRKDLYRIVLEITRAINTHIEDPRILDALKRDLNAIRLA